MEACWDLLVIGGGINGVGIARDAAGRGLSVVLCEQRDIGGATSSASSKLIHGGLRYLEHFDFGLVAESLAEREVLLRIAPHLARPRRFVLPHVAELRPAWLMQCGLLLYDGLGAWHAGCGLPRFERIQLADDLRGAPLKPDYRLAFVYSDATVDDARLTLACARSAAEQGARILPRTRVLSARRAADAWVTSIADAHGRRELYARALVDATGPWAGGLLESVTGRRTRLRLVRGSHIVVPRLYDGDQAYTLQNDDGRVCFVLPLLRDFSLIGTTEIEIERPEEGHEASAAEVEYLCRAAGRYFRRGPRPRDVVWSFAGMRPLVDDGHLAATMVSREYRIEVDAGLDGRRPLLTVFGGKLTTHRRLAEAVLHRLAPWFPSMGGSWTAGSPLPGGEVPARDWPSFLGELCRSYAALPPTWLEDLAGRHGTQCHTLLDGVRDAADLGRDFGGGLCEREVEYCMAREWAMAPEDVLWRRTKCGLVMSAEQRAAFADWFRRRKS